MEIFHANEAYVRVCSISKRYQVFTVSKTNKEMVIDNYENTSVYPVITIEPKDSDVTLSGDFIKELTGEQHKLTLSDELVLVKAQEDKLVLDINGANGFAALNSTDITDQISGKPIVLPKHTHNIIQVDPGESSCSVIFEHDYPSNTDMAVGYLRNCTISIGTEIMARTNIYGVKHNYEMFQNITLQGDFLYLDNTLQDLSGDIRLTVDLLNSDGRYYTFHIFGNVDNWSSSWTENELVHQNIRLLGTDIIKLI